MVNTLDYMCSTLYISIQSKSNIDSECMVEKKVLPLFIWIKFHNIELAQPRQTANSPTKIRNEHGEPTRQNGRQLEW